MEKLKEGILLWKTEDKNIGLKSKEYIFGLKIIITHPYC
jgi:hypothetical protein